MASFGSAILLSGLTGTARTLNNMQAMRRQQRYQQQQFALAAGRQQAALETAQQKQRAAGEQAQSSLRARAGAMGVESTGGSSLAVLRGLRETGDSRLAETQQQARQDRQSLLLDIAASRAGYRHQMAGSLLTLGETLYSLRPSSSPAPAEDGR